MKSRFPLKLLPVALLTLALAAGACCLFPKQDEAANKTDIEAALPSLAATLAQQKPDDAGKAKLFEDYLARNPEVYAVAFAPAPPPAGKFELPCPYVFRLDGALRTVDLAKPGYNYLDMDWYTLPIKNKAPVWSPVYFDSGGGEIWMTTYSYPIYLDDAKTQLYGILTDDLQVPAPK